MLTTLLFWMAVITLVIWSISALEIILGTRSLRSLTEMPPLDPATAPRVSVVVAARDEERQIEPALRSLLAQNYPDLEVIVVDDRSTDSTASILKRLTRQHSRLRVIHLSDLPDGWLGKNHALQRGAEAATGDWLLFTDADVVLDPLALSRALGYAMRHDVDHLVVAPRLDMPSRMLDLFVGTFSIFFLQYTRPWRARDPSSGSHVGVGAFNLLRRRAYESIGGHGPISMRPDDDVKLGKLVKLKGFRQDFLMGLEAVRVEWYASVGEAIHGLEKNSFAALNYSVLAVGGTLLAMLLLNVWPFVAVLVMGGATRWLNLGTVAVIWTVYAGGSGASGSNPLYGLGFPVAVLLLAYTIARATVLALVHGGIRWRGRKYPLDQLRANRI